MDPGTILPLIKIIAVFAAMLGAMRAGLGVGPAIFAGGLFLDLVFGHGPVHWLRTVAAGVFSAKALYLAGIVWVITALSGTMEKTGRTERLMDSLKGYLRSARFGLVFFPALIGLLPMPGGALFSAPMVGSFSRRMDLADADRAALNYWFRHIWELAWPLYPGFILAAGLADVPLAGLLVYDLPGVLLCVALGWIFVLRPGRLKIGAAPARGERDPGRALALGAPLAVAILGAIGLELFLASAFPGAPFEIGVIAAVTVALVLVLLLDEVKPSVLAGLFFGRKTLSMLLVIAAIFAFQEVLKRAGVVDELAAMAGGEAALYFSATALPFLVGLVSGITLAYVGAAFPLMLGLLERMGRGDELMAFVVLGMFAGFSGVMVSPIHVCFVLTCKYFNVPPAEAWRKIAPPALMILVVGLAYFLLLLSL
jgi:hypothetical protein